jgi:hypothetical protein
MSGINTTELGWRGLSRSETPPDKMTKPRKTPIIYPQTQKSFPPDKVTGDILSYIIVYIYMFREYVLKNYIWI